MLMLPKLVQRVFAKETVMFWDFVFQRLPQSGRNKLEYPECLIVVIL